MLGEHYAVLPCGLIMALRLAGAGVSLEEWGPGLVHPSFDDDPGLVPHTSSLLAVWLSPVKDGPPLSDSAAQPAAAQNTNSKHELVGPKQEQEGRDLRLHETMHETRQALWLPHVPSG